MNNRKSRYNAIKDRIGEIEVLSKTDLSRTEKQILLYEAVELGISLAQIALEMMAERNNEYDDGF